MCSLQWKTLGHCQMEKANKRGYCWGVSLLVVYCLLMLAAVLQTSTAQSCPTGCSGCGTTTVDCRYAGLTSFPQLPLTVQQSVQTLRLDNNDIQSLEPNVLENYINLRYLYLHGNQLTSLPEGLLDTTTQLQWLYLGGNQLTSLPEGLLNTTTQLQRLDLLSNQLTSLPEGLLHTTTQLRLLHLYSNQLTSLPEGLLNTTTQLQGLYLHSNRLTSLPEGLLNTTTQLQYLYLNSNQLTSLPEGLLNTTTQLQRLYLYDNQLKSLPEGILTSLSTMTQLQYLFFYSNPWNCDCELRKLPAILNSVTYTSGSNQPTCATPINLNGDNIASLTEDQLVCECIPACVNGACNMTVGACECTDGYIGLDCNITTCPMTHPTLSIEPSSATGSNAQCPSEQERSEVIDSISADVLTSVREKILPLLQEDPEACKN